MIGDLPAHALAVGLDIGPEGLVCYRAPGAGGELIRKASYGTQGKYGWKVSTGGSAHGRNPRALHIEANRKKVG